MRIVGSALMVITSCSPGSTTPAVGLTVSHLAPAVAVNEIGPAVVESSTLWAGGGIGGATMVIAVALKVSVAGGLVTVSVTGMLNGLVTPVIVTMIVAV